MRNRIFYIEDLEDPTLFRKFSEIIFRLNLYLPLLSEELESERTMLIKELDDIQSYVNYDTFESIKKLLLESIESSISTTLYRIIDIDETFNKDE